MTKTYSTRAVNITAEAFQILVTMANDAETFRKNYQPSADGTFNFIIGESNLKRLKNVQLEGETLSDVIVRFAAGKVN